MKKAKKKKTTEPKKVTLHIGTVHTRYVQTEVPVKHAKDVAEALAQMLLSDYHRAFCSPDGSDDHNE